MRDYFRGDFRTELSSLEYEEPGYVLQGALDLDDTVFFGGPDWKKAEQDLLSMLIADPCRFVLCLFMVVLNDQAMYTCRPDVSHLWRKRTLYPKFGWGVWHASREPVQAAVDTGKGKPRSV